MNAFKLALAQLEYGKRKNDWTLATGLSQALVAGGFSSAEQLRGQFVSEELLIGTAMETLLPAQAHVRMLRRRTPDYRLAYEHFESQL